MGLLNDMGDLLTGIPTASVLRERLALAQERHETELGRLRTELEAVRAENTALRAENAELKVRVPAAAARGTELSPKATELLVLLFKAGSNDRLRSKRALMQTMQVTDSLFEYHLEELEERSLAQFSHAVIGEDSFYAATKEGRAHVVKNGLQ